MKLNFSFRFLLIFLSITMLAGAQSLQKSYLFYIHQYYEIAEKQQKEHGIPASIILAQGLLESGAGESELTRMSNNHFGIKCTDWTGPRVYHDDDIKGDCFRKYDRAIDSYEDHVNFLKTRKRYAFLFNLKPTDYESWAFGLKKAGYATDPSYAYKLISIIENYNLHRFDLGLNYADDTKNNNSVPENYSYGNMGTIQAIPDHQVYKINKVRCINALPGDSYAVIADIFNIKEKRLREFNEVDADTPLQSGEVVYLSKKRQQADKTIATHIVEAGETMHNIAQNFGIQTKSLYDMNQMSYTEGAQVGQVLKLH